MKATFRFALIDILLLVALAAGIIGAFKGFWFPGQPNNPWLFGALYLCVLTVATLLAAYLRNPARIPILGAVIFGWLYLILILRMDSKDFTMAHNFDYAVKVGLAFFALSALATHLGFRIFNNKSR